jgi:hypothetical protein
MNEQKMVTTKYCIDIRTKSKTCRQTENGYYEVFSNTSIPKAKQRTKMVTTTCIIRAHQKQGLKQVKQTNEKRLLRRVNYTYTPKAKLKASKHTEIGYYVVSFYT